MANPSVDPLEEVSSEVLIQSIKEIIENSDLNTMTAKLVRNELKTKLNVQDLDSRKQQINRIINEVISDLSKRRKNHKIKDNNKDSNELVDKKPINVKSESNESPIKKSKDSDNDSTGSSSDEIEDDEGLARKLHNEEMDSKRRVTRNARNVKKRSLTKTKTKSDETKPKPKRKSGFTKPCVLSTELADFLGSPEMARHEVVKRIWSYVRENNLFDPKNKQFAICDNPLNKIFGRKRVRMFGMMKILAKHLN